MNRHIIGAAAVFLLISGNALATVWSADGPIGNLERGCQDEGMYIMPPLMRPPGMGIMEGIPEADHIMWKHLTGLGLDEKQRESMKEVKNRIMKETIKKRADWRIAGIELKDLLDKEPVNMKVVEAKLKQIETLKTETHLSLIRAREEVKSKLTPEQRKNFREMLEKEPGMGFPLIGGMMRCSMKMMPPPPCDKKEEIQQEMEHIPYKAK
jgi:Spy/CpxP family protein refolding chaperone